MNINNKNVFRQDLYSLLVCNLLWILVWVRHPWGVLVLLELQVNSQKRGVQAPQNLEFE